MTYFYLSVTITYFVGTYGYIFFYIGFYGVFYV